MQSRARSSGVAGRSEDWGDLTELDRHGQWTILYGACLAGPWHEAKLVAP